jgi:membrane protein YdbS with pleckstrin-like domain
LTSRRRAERDALGGTLDPSYPRHPPDPYTGHIPAEHGGAEPEPEPEPSPSKPRLHSRVGRRLSSLRRTYLPLPDEIVDDHLGHGERKIHSDHPSFRAFIIEHVLLVIALFVIVGLFVGVVLNGSMLAIIVTFILLSVVMLALVLKRLSERYTSYVITNVRIMRIAGVVTRRVHSIPWMRVTDLSFDQSGTGRIFGYATLRIESANEEGGLRALTGISNPIRFNQYLVDMVVAKQGPIAPGWEELGEPGPAAVLARRQRVGLRDRVREVRRRRRELRLAEAGLETPTRPRPQRERPGRPPSEPPEAGEPVRYTDPRRIVVPDDETELLSSGAPVDTGGRGEGPAPPDRTPDPLREGPESSLPWGRE